MLPDVFISNFPHISSISGNQMVLVITNDIYVKTVTLSFVV